MNINSKIFIFSKILLGSVSLMNTFYFLFHKFDIPKS